MYIPIKAYNAYIGFTEKKPYNPKPNKLKEPIKAIKE